MFARKIKNEFISFLDMTKKQEKRTTYRQRENHELKEELSSILQRLGNSQNRKQVVEGIALLQSGIRGVIKDPQQLQKQIEEVLNDIRTIQSRISRSTYFTELDHLAALAKEGYNLNDAEIILPAYNDDDYVMTRDLSRFGRDQLRLAPYLERILQREGMLFFAGETRVWMKTQYGNASLTKPTLLIAGHPSEFGGFWPNWLPQLWIYSPQDKKSKEDTENTSLMDGREGVASWINIPLSSAEIRQRIDYFSDYASRLEFYITQHPSLAAQGGEKNQEPKVIKKTEEECREGLNSSDVQFERLLKDNPFLNEATLLTIKSEGRLYYLPHAEWEVESGVIRPK